jgi:hypothetical protein
MAADPNHHRKQPVEGNEEQPFLIERDDRIDWERKQKRRRERPDYDELDDYDLDDFSNGERKPKKSNVKKRRRVRNNARLKGKALLDDFYDEDTGYYP